MSEPKKVHELTFKIRTYEPWSEEGIEKIGLEFNQRYDGNLAIESAWLDAVELVDAPEQEEEVYDFCLRCGAKLGSDEEENRLHEEDCRKQSGEPLGE